MGVPGSKGSLCGERALIAAMNSSKRVLSGEFCQLIQSRSKPLHKTLPSCSPVPFQTSAGESRIENVRRERLSLTRNKGLREIGCFARSQIENEPSDWAKIDNPGKLLCSRVGGAGHSWASQLYVEPWRSTLSAFSSSKIMLGVP